jgi:pimeloyl-ACP methyl ester carboxylesterase
MAIAVLVLGLGLSAGAWRLVDSQRGPDKRTEVAPDSALDQQCRRVPDGARRITLTAEDGTTLGGALVGAEDAAVGVVIRQGRSQRICDWLPLAGELAQETGALVLLFDRRGSGSSPGDPDLSAEPGDTLTAIDRLSDEGVDRVGLLASSMGNAVAFATLPLVGEPPCVLISISPVLATSDASGSLDASDFGALPDNVWVTFEQGNPAIAQTSADLAAALKSRGQPEVHLLPVDTDDHSIDLVNNHDEVRAFVTEAAASCGAP